MKESIVEQGDDLIFGSESYRKKAEEIRLHMTIEYAPAYAKASWWRKWMIQLKIERQIAKELRKYDPRYRL